MNTASAQSRQASRGAEETVIHPGHRFHGPTIRFFLYIFMDKGTSWSSVVVPGGVVVAESGGEEFPENWEHRKYGDTHIHILEV